MYKAAQAYLQTQVTTTNQGDILLLLYDTAIKYLKQSKERMAQRDYAGKGILISKALDVIGELDASLNQQKGGEIAVNLHKLYEYCNFTLLQANIRLDPVRVDEAIRILTGLRSAFWQISGAPGKTSEPAQAAAPSPPAPAAAYPVEPPHHETVAMDQPSRMRNRLAGYGM